MVSNKNRIIYFITLMYLAVTGNNLFSQTSILDNYLLMAYENNLELKISILEEQKQQVKIEQVKKLINPRLNMSASYMLAEGGRKINFPVGDLLNPVNQILNQLSGMDDLPTNIENIDNQLTPNNYLDIQSSLSKPIVAPTIKPMISLQEKWGKIKEIETKKAKNELRFDVKEAYFNYLKTFEALKILSLNKVALLEVLSFNQKLVKHSKATKDVISQVELELANLENQREKLKEQNQLSQALFNFLLNRDLDEKIEMDSLILQNLSIDSSLRTQIVQTAIEHRAELKLNALEKKLHDLNIVLVKNGSKPTIDVFAGVGFQTEHFSFDNGGPLILAGARLNWDILDGGIRKKRIEELKVDTKILDINKSRIAQQIELEIIQNMLSLQSTQKKLKLQEIAFKNAYDSHKIIDSKYRNGQILLIEWIVSNNKLITSKLSFALIKYDLLINLANLEKTISR